MLTGVNYSGANAVIRPYRPSDQPGVEWLYSRTPPWGRTYVRPEPVPEDIRRISTAFEYVVVAVEQDRAGEAVVGLTTVAPARPDATVPMPAFFDLTRPTARLHHVTVAPERWRQGIGRLLVQDAIAWARQAGYRSLILNTTIDQRGAVAFYLALGFREAGHTTFRDWELVWFDLAL
jgi:GNAT superfamily N-acetyltransferase